jgi:tetratricopeptide (TPR) repeat protein
MNAARHAVARAEAALAIGRFETAAADAARAIAADASWPDGYAQLARANLGLGRFKEALRAADAGLAVCSDSVWLYRLRALVLAKCGRRKEARAAADEAIRLDPNSAAAHSARSLVLTGYWERKLAIASAERAVELAPDNAGFLAHLGLLLLRKDPKRAEKLLRESLAIEPNDAAVLNNLGVALHRQRRALDAALAYKAAILVDPALGVAKRNAHSTVNRLLYGGSLLITVGVLARSFFQVSTVLMQTAPTGVRIAVPTGSLVVAVALYFAVRRRRRRQLQAKDPQLLEIYARLEADRKAGRLKQ